MFLRNILLLLIVNLGSVSCSNLTSGCDYKSAKEYVRIPSSIEEKGYVSDVFAGINSVRVSKGLTPFKRDGDIDRLAEIHNVCMMSRVEPNKKMKISHRNSFDRFLILQEKGYVAYGENTAAFRGYRKDQNASQFVNGWVSSAKHYANIVADFTHSGLAITIDKRDGTVFGTQIFTK